MIGNVTKALCGIATGSWKIPPMKLEMMAAKAAASRATITACRARLPSSVVVEEPNALRTAKSRTRCSAETYNNAAMMMPAMTHMRIFVLLIDDTAEARPSSVRCSTPAVVKTCSPGGTDLGTPVVTTAVMMGRPPSPSACAFLSGR
jgi:hypothetical protein